ncbi:MAG: hypothetical protein GY906_22530 [bacterium]|nr:hypothetical protein [bacterium]
MAGFAAVPRRQTPGSATMDRLMGRTPAPQGTQAMARRPAPRRIGRGGGRGGFFGLGQRGRFGDIMQALQGMGGAPAPVMGRSPTLMEGLKGQYGPGGAPGVIDTPEKRDAAMAEARSLREQRMRSGMFRPPPGGFRSVNQPRLMARTPAAPPPVPAGTEGQAQLPTPIQPTQNTINPATGQPFPGQSPPFASGGFGGGQGNPFAANPQMIQRMMQMLRQRMGGGFAGGQQQIQPYRPQPAPVPVNNFTV